MLEDGLREQLAAALLGWGGGDGGGMQRKSSESTDNDDCDRGTPKTERALSVGHRQGYIRGLMEYADKDGEGTAVDDDIDADSTHDASDSFHAPSEAGWRSRERPRDTNPAERSAPAAAEKALPPLPVDTPTPLASPGSPPLEMSCRISRFPFSHPCEVPELMPDQEDIPSVSDPVTPCVTTEVFRPLTEVLSPHLELGPFSHPASQPDLYERVPRMAIKSVVSELSLPNVPDSIPEEEDDDDVNTDGVSMLTPTEVSFDTGDGESSSTQVDKHAFLSVDNSRPSQSVSSLGSGSMSSSEWRPSQANGPRKSISLFSRRRGPLEEECLERRSLTPAQLNTPGPTHPGSLFTPGPASPTSPTLPSASPSRAETSMASRFFQHMPWMHDSRPGKPEAVFGVDLKESIRVAPMKIRISHKGRSTSYRTFPLSVYKCCEFIRRAGMLSFCFSSRT
jgi:hypothetical protein